MPAHSGRRKGAAIFVASVCVSLVVLGTCLLLFLLYMKAAQAEAVKHDVAVREYYQPDVSENLQILLIGCEQAESPPELLLFCDYNAPEGILTLIGLPSRTICEWNGRTDTIAGHYDYEGVRGAVNAVNELLYQNADRYARTQKTGLSNLVDYLGGARCDLEMDRIIGGQTMLAGKHLLDGRQTSELLFQTGVHGVPDTALQAELAACVARGGLTERIAERYDSFGDAFFYDCETNLSRYDFVLREKGACRWMKTGELRINCLVLEGGYNGDYSAFTPDEASRREIAAMLGGEAFEKA